MSESEFTTTVELSKTTENYAVYDGPELPGGQQVAGMYVALAAFEEEPPEYLDVLFGEEEAVPLEVVKANGEGNSIRFRSESDAISGIYVWPSAIGSDVFGTAESEETVETPAISIRPSDEESFEAVLDENDEELQEEASALMGDSDEADDSDEEQELQDEADELVADD